jgi:prepilin-type N-terminal cleavage/methylation domain-containing protein
MNRPVGSPDQGGFTLVEAMVAIVLLAVSSLALGALLMRASRTAIAAASTVQATASLSTEVGRLQVLPFDQLSSGTSCVTVNTPPYPHTRCTTVNNVSSKVREVIVVVTPSGNSLLKPDTVKMSRTKNGNNSPLNTP